jgi:hypothetical protein
MKAWSRAVRNEPIGCDVKSQAAWSTTRSLRRMTGEHEWGAEVGGCVRGEADVIEGKGGCGRRDVSVIEEEGGCGRRGVRMIGEEG